MKRPWLVALLNVFPVPLGLGYLYLGRPGRFALAFLGALLATGAGLGLLVLAFFTAKGGSVPGAIALLILAPVPLLLLAGLTAWNAYSLAGRTAAPQETFRRQAGKLVLALILVGVPVTLGVLLLDPRDHWRGPPYTNTLALSPAFATDRTLFVGATDRALYVGAPEAEGILRSIDAGENWQRAGQGMPSEYSFALALSPAFATDHTLFAAVTNEGIFRSTDAGDSWQWASQGRSSVYVHAFAFSPAFATDRTLFAATGNGGIFRSTNAGESWQRLSQGMPSLYMHAFAFSPAFATDRTLFVGATDRALYVGAPEAEGILRSIDAGENWQRAGQGMPSVYSFALALSPAFATDRTLFAASLGGIFRSTDAGESWQRPSQGIATTSLHALALSPAFATDRTLFAAASPEGIYRSTDAGESWQGSIRSPSVYLFTFAFSPAFATDRTLFAAVSFEGIYRSTDAGESWRDLGWRLTSPWVPTTAFALGSVLALVLAGALVVTWNTGGLGRITWRWWRPLWVVAGLGNGIMLILLGLVDDTVGLVYLGGSTIALLVMGFVALMASTAIVRQPRLEPLPGTRGTVRCLHCGQDSPAGARFCGHCGILLAAH